MRSGATPYRASAAAVAATGDHDGADGGESAPLAVLELCRHAGIEPGFGGERMMHERDDAQPLAFACDFVRQHAERQPVDEDGRAVRNRREHPRPACSRAPGVGNGKLSSSDSTSTRPAALAKAGDHAAVVAVATGPRLEVAGNDDGQRQHRQNATARSRRAVHAPLE